MLRFALILVLGCAACDAVEQPKSAKTVAAYEVLLPTPSDRRRFVALLTRQAVAFGYHVDAATEEELKLTSDVFPQTFNASVWRGKDDEESMASAMDFEGALGRVWIAFPSGRDPLRSRQFRETLVPAVKRHWPDTASLPIMATGAIPLPKDLVRTPQGYIVRPSAAAKYQDKSR